VHHRLGRDIAAAAGPVVDDERLPEPFREPLSQQARDDVVAAGSGKAEAHRSCRIGLGLREPRYCRKSGGERAETRN
jgi:hypothetical protein